MMKKANLILVAAPSGAGKSSFIERILRENSRLVDIITYTTRSPRTHEKQGDPYYFVEKDEFVSLRDRGFFLEWAEVHGNLYGTPRDQVDAAMVKGKVVIIDIDVQGVRSLKAFYPQAVSLFILPPSIEELKRRIISRDTKVPSNLDLRLQNAAREMLEAPSFDYQIVNDKFEDSYGQFKKLVEGLI